MPVRWLDLSHDGWLLALSSASMEEPELWVIEGLFGSAK